MSLCLIHGIRDGAACDICEAKGSEMPVAELAPITEQPPEENASQTSAKLGGNGSNRSCEQCVHCLLSNGAQVRCDYPRERQPEVVDLTTRSGWTSVNAASICKHFQ
jgi:hypothetical protein